MSNKEIIVELDRIVPEGKAVGTFEGKSVYVIGGLPGEKVKVSIFREKKNFAEANIVEFITKSPHRIEPKENHYMSCSPWQSVDYDYQKELKRDILIKCFKSLASTEIDPASLDFYFPTKLYNYRNKLEFSFGPIGNDKGVAPRSPNEKLFLAFHERGSHDSLIELNEGCQLGLEDLNKTALEILNAINKTDITEWDLKTLTVRQSAYNNEVIALLLVKNESERTLKAIETIKDADVKNLVIGFSSHKSPVSNLDKVLFAKGVDYLTESVLGKELRYSMQSFFQNNVEAFEVALEKIKEYVKESNKIVELYSGVGTIGLNLAEKAKEVTGVEIVESAVVYAKLNADINNIANYKAVLTPAEKLHQETIEGADIVVLDPPRSGLHPKVIKMLKEAKPKRIIYLSCNPISQASDYNNLKELYNLIHLSGYDFYPNTLHLESLAILDLK